MTPQKNVSSPTCIDLCANFVGRSTLILLKCTTHSNCTSSQDSTPLVMDLPTGAMSCVIVTALSEPCTSDYIPCSSAMPARTRRSDISGALARTKFPLFRFRPLTPRSNRLHGERPAITELALLSPFRIMLSVHLFGAISSPFVPKSCESDGDIFGSR